MKLSIESPKIQQVLTDKEMTKELSNLIESDIELPSAKQWNVNKSMIGKVINEKLENVPAIVMSRPYTEAVILEYMRPSLLIQNNQFQVPFSDELASRLLNSKYTLEKRIPSVGRIEFVNHPSMQWGGSGWVIAENLIVTNRHVASLFSNVGPGGDFIFSTDIMGNQIKSNIDFYEEYINPREYEIQIEKIEYIETDKNKPDFALLRLKKSSNNPSPIPIASLNPKADQNIAVIGYPARDPRGLPDEEVAARVFGDIYDVKRLSPGKVRISDKNNWFFTHDATTLGGNSGSVVLDMETGYAVGLHFAGILKEANFAIKGSELLNYLAKSSISVSNPNEYIPTSSNFDTELLEEGTIEDYRDRKGYQNNFLGSNNKVELPSINNSTDIYKFQIDNEDKEVLTYTHFSLVMSKSRRMCFYSAVNVDGSTVKRFKRRNWRYDPRLPKDFQIRYECYGNFPKFSRGHMTRRKDPMWGTAETARKGNDDSMHVTNAVPQIQPFNAGIWLDLEDYALDNAKKDDMKISVITGPFFKDSDRIKWDVKIPTDFWKIICFIHDETGKLCATGYTLSQGSYLPNQEFVFGSFRTYQTPISVIERMAQLDFQGLSDLDPLRKFDESIPVPLTDFSQIKLI